MPVIFLFFFFFKPVNDIGLCTSSYVNETITSKNKNNRNKTQDITEHILFCYMICLLRNEVRGEVRILSQHPS